MFNGNLELYRNTLIFSDKVESQLPRRYSDQTLAELARFMESRFSHSDLSSLFLYVSVPDAFQAGSNKHARSLNAIKYLSHVDDFTAEPEHAEALDLLFDQVVKRASQAFTGTDQMFGLSKPFNEIADSFRRALKADGYEIIEGNVVPADELEFELASETSILEQKLHTHGMSDALNTLKQAHQNFIDGHLESCNAMLRTSLEGVLKHIAIQIAGGIEKIPVNNSTHGVSPADARKYLRKENFFQEDEVEFVRTFYGYASSDGSHPGMSNESESRLRRLMVVALIQYCLEKFEARLT